jgi:ankyrin repeat protein
MRKGLSLGYPSITFPNPASASHSMTLSCLKYLQLKDLLYNLRELKRLYRQSHRAFSNFRNQIAKKYPFLEFALTHWPTFTLIAYDDSYAEDLWESFNSLFQSKDRAVMLFDYFSSEILDFHGFMLMPNALVVACHVHEFIDNLIDHTFDINIRSNQELLRIAVNKGNEKIVRLLVEAGVDMNILNYLGSDRGTTLQLALKNNHEPIARFLIEKGVDINGGTLQYEMNALQIAVKNGDFAVSSF